MLAKLSAEGLIRDFDLAEGKLQGVFGRESSKSIPLNRRTVIVALQFLRMAPRDMTVRMAKLPARSRPWTKSPEASSSIPESPSSGYDPRRASGRS